MDPVETLRNARETAAAIVAIIDNGDDPEELETLAADLAEHFQALDQWMCRDGFNPWNIPDPRKD